jgi:hypothetical protein
MTTTLKLLGDSRALTEYFDRRLSCLCDDKLGAIESGAQLMQALVNLHLLSATFETCVLNLGHTLIVQPQFVQDDGVSPQLAASRSLEIYRLIVNGSQDKQVCPTRGTLGRRQVARGFLREVAAALGFSEQTVTPTERAFEQAQRVEQILNPGRPMTEQEFFRALGFYLAWTHYCWSQFQSLDKYLMGWWPIFTAELKVRPVKTFYGNVNAFTWIGDSIEHGEQNFLAAAKASLLVLDYYAGTTDVDTLGFWLVDGINAFDSVEDAFPYA